jgi:hypothetical protein
MAPPTSIVTASAFDYDAQHIRALSTGDTVARAKRTSSERAAARRRYRAATDPIDSDAGDVASEPTRAAPSTRTVADGVRLGIGTALRQSFRPLRVREDLAALPSLIPNRALWLPILVTVATAVATTVTGGNDVVTALLFTYFIVTPAIGGVFLAGFLAPRASWLLGIIVALVAAGCYIVMGITGRLPAPFSEQFTNVPSAAVISSLLISPVIGAFFASAAAWYRRFLSLTNPNRGRRSQTAQKRTDGRSRGGTPPKANAKAAARR